MLNINGLKIPAFDEKNFSRETENRYADVVTVFDADEALYRAYISYFEGCGATVKEQRRVLSHFYTALSLGEGGIFINFFESIGELYITTEAKTEYFGFCDSELPAICEPQLSQLTLIDFGMSYVVRLSDGRFIVIDGGNEHDFDSDSLLSTLKAGQVGEDIVIAAWIFTHPHLDHFHAFLSFMDRFPTATKIERFMFNFPEVDDSYHYPALQRPNDKAIDTVPRMYAHIEAVGAPIYILHTGQRYRIGDASLEVLASLDDAIHLAPGVTSDVNITSTVFRMELGGQVILFGSDSYFEYIRFAEKHGEYLKSDILQVPHHGFGGARPVGQIAAYKLIAPSVCLFPVCDYDAYTSFCTYIPSSRFLMLEAGIDELITGDKTRTLTLPYTACEGGVEEIRRNFVEGLKKGGAFEWEFSGLSGSFSLFARNRTHRPSKVTVKLLNSLGESIGERELEVRGNSADTYEIAADGAVAARISCTVTLQLSIEGADEGIQKEIVLVDYI